MLEKGATFKITIDEVQGDVNICGTTFKGLPGDVSIGDQLLIDDGKVGLRATDVPATTVTTDVEVPGPVTNTQGHTHPSLGFNIPAPYSKREKKNRWGNRLFQKRGGGGGK